MNVRLATAEDAAAIAALHAESWRSAYRGILRDDFLDGAIDDDRRALWDKRLSPTAPDSRPFVALAELDGVALAFVCVLLDVDPMRGALLNNLHVAPASKGRGLGRRLMAEAAIWIRQQRPHSGMHLWVFEQNLPARAFYERLGGVMDERSVHVAPDGSHVQAVRYCWEDPGRLAEHGEKDPGTAKATPARGALRLV